MVRSLKYFAITLMLLIALSFTFERQAHAYVDPGSGLLIFQGISAVFSGALFYFRRRLKNLFVRAPKSLPSPAVRHSVVDIREKCLIAFPWSAPATVRLRNAAPRSWFENGVCAHDRNSVTSD